jgi:hypothetical protein
MIGSIQRRATKIVVAALAVCLLPLAARAGTINIILSDMDVTYMGSTHTLDPAPDGSMYDAMGGHSGGNLAEATADDITTAVFELDGNPVGTLINTGVDGDDLHADLHIDGMGTTIQKNVFHPSKGANGDAFGLDFFTDTGFKLRIYTDTVSLFLSNSVFFFSGEGLVYDQTLPFGLQPLSQTIPVTFSFTATYLAVPGGTNVSLVTGSGALTITGVQVPEPSTNLLLGGASVVFGLAILQRRRMKALMPVPARR